MTKEDLIGRKLITNNGELYTISDYNNPATVYITLVSTRLNPEVKNRQPTAYPVERLIEFIEKGGWKLMDKQYTIEELVGKSFRAAPNGTGQVNYIYEHYNKERVYVSTTPNLTTEQCRLKTGIDVGDWRVSNISENLNDGTWKLIEDPMKDKYKIGTVVKSIKYGGEYIITGYKLNGVTFDKAGSPGELFTILETNYTIIKELTKSNMYKTKGGIEYGVGTQFQHPVGSDKVYTLSYVDSDGVGWDGACTRTISLKRFNELLDAFDWVIVGQSTKEIIAYETVVDLPGIPKGTKFSNHLIGDAALIYPFTASVNGKTYSYDRADVLDTKFFKPIYKAEEVDIKFSKYTAKLSKDKGLVFSDGEKLSFKDLEGVITQLGKTNAKVGKFGGFDVTADYELTVKSVKVGCKSFTADDVKLITEATKKLD